MFSIYIIVYICKMYTLYLNIIINITNIILYFTI